MLQDDTLWFHVQKQKNCINNNQNKWISYSLFIFVLRMFQKSSLIYEIEIWTRKQHAINKHVIVFGNVQMHLDIKTNTLFIFNLKHITDLMVDVWLYIILYIFYLYYILEFALHFYVKLWINVWVNVKNGKTCKNIDNKSLFKLKWNVQFTVTMSSLFGFVSYSLLYLVDTYWPMKRHRYCILV